MISFISARLEHTCIPLPLLVFSPGLTIHMLRSLIMRSLFSIILLLITDAGLFLMGLIIKGNFTSKSGYFRGLKFLKPSKDCILFLYTCFKDLIRGSSSVEGIFYISSTDSYYYSICVDDSRGISSFFELLFPFLC